MLHRSERRHRRERVIARRLRICAHRSATMPTRWQPAPGRLAKWNTSCSCAICKLAHRGDGDEKASDRRRMQG